MKLSIQKMVGKILTIIVFGFLPVCIVVSVVFYDTTLIQFIGMALITLVDMILLVCASRQNYYRFFKSEKGRVYYDFFYYDWITPCLIGAFWFFCPIVDF